MFFIINIYNLNERKGYINTLECLFMLYKG